MLQITSLPPSNHRKIYQCKVPISRDLQGQVNKGQMFPHVQTFPHMQKMVIVTVLLEYLNYITCWFI